MGRFVVFVGLYTSSIFGVVKHRRVTNSTSEGPSWADSPKHKWSEAWDATEWVLRHWVGFMFLYQRGLAREYFHS